MTDPASVHTVASLAQLLRGEVRGDGGVIIRGIDLLHDAGPGDLTFVGDGRYVKRWAKSRAAAALVTVKLAPMFDAADARPLILVPDADFAVLDLLRRLEPPEPLPDEGVHPTAWIHPEAVLGAQVRIGPHVSVDRGARLGDGVVLHAGVRIYADVVIDAESVLHANVVVRQRCRIGRRVVLHQNVSIGADGFGYLRRPGGGGFVKLPHIGDVVIEDDVEIGANTCVDRAKFGSTVIGAGTKIDNLCQIGHNASVGRNCTMSGCVAIGGTAVIEDGVQLGGRAGVSDHVRVGAGARVGACGVAIRDVPPGESWAGFPADEAKQTLRQWAAIRRLPDALRQMSREVPPPR